MNAVNCLFLNPFSTGSNLNSRHCLLTLLLMSYCQKVRAISYVSQTARMDTLVKKRSAAYSDMACSRWVVREVIKELLKSYCGYCVLSLIMLMCIVRRFQLGPRISSHRESVCRYISWIIFSKCWCSCYGSKSLVWIELYSNVVQKFLVRLPKFRSKIYQNL